MSYQVPQHIDPNKVFLINHSELEGRLDSMFYTRQFSDIIVALKKCFLYKRLGQIALFSSESWNQKDYYETVFPYIEIGAINITDGKIDDVSFVPVEQAPSRAKVIVRTGDIIISTTRPDRGAIIKITENENLYIASTGFSVIRNIDSNINPDYLLAILRHKLILLQMRQRSTGGNYPAITQEELSKIIIPIPPVDIQNKIVSLIESAHTKKQEADFVANSLVQSIDEYLLGELGIERPSPTRTENGRFFYTSFHNLMGSEWTPLSIKNNGKRSKSTIYKEAKLSTIATIAKGQAITSKEIVSGNYPVIAGGQSSPYSHNQYNYKGNIVTISASGAYSGYVWYHNYPIFASDCSVIFSNDENVYLTKYIYEILRLRQQEIYLLQKGAGQPHVYPSDIANLTIPAIPLDKQQDIVAYCQELRNKAELLQKEGRDIISTAKDAIEQMIIGN